MDIIRKIYTKIAAAIIETGNISQNKNVTSTFANHVIEAMRSATSLSETEILVNASIPLDLRTTNRRLAFLMCELGAVLLLFELVLTIGAEVLDHFHPTDEEQTEEDPGGMAATLYLSLFGLLMFLTLMVMSGTSLGDGHFSRNLPD